MKRNTTMDEGEVSKRRKESEPAQGVAQELDEMTDPRLFEKEDPHMHLRHGRRKKSRRVSFEIHPTRGFVSSQQRLTGFRIYKRGSEERSTSALRCRYRTARGRSERKLRKLTADLRERIPASSTTRDSSPPSLNFPNRRSFP